MGGRRERDKVNKTKIKTKKRERGGECKREKLQIDR